MLLYRRAPQNRVKYCVSRYYRILLDLDLKFPRLTLNSVWNKHKPYLDTQYSRYVVSVRFRFRRGGFILSIFRECFLWSKFYVLPSSHNTPCFIDIPKTWKLRHWNNQQFRMHGSNWRWFTGFCDYGDGDRSLCWLATHWKRCLELYTWNL